MLFMREVLEDRTDPKGLEMARSPPNGKRHGPGGVGGWIQAEEHV